MFCTLCYYTERGCRLEERTRYPGIGPKVFFAIAKFCKICDFYCCCVHYYSVHYLLLKQIKELS